MEDPKEYAVRRYREGVRLKENDQHVEALKKFDDC